MLLFTTTTLLAAEAHTQHPPHRILTAVSFYICITTLNRTNTSSAMDPLELSPKELEELIAQAGGDMGECWAQHWSKVQYND